MGDKIELSEATIELVRRLAEQLAAPPDAVIRVCVRAALVNPRPMLDAEMIEARIGLVEARVSLLEQAHKMEQAHKKKDKS